MNPRFDTRQIVFSAPRPLPPTARCLAFGFCTYRLAGFRRADQFILAGATVSILGWITGALFIPSLALAFGTLTGSSKAFEVLYVLWMYLLTQKCPCSILPD